MKFPKVIYFSMEFGLRPELPIYSGGLGVLAADHLKAAAELELPLIGVGLLYRKGFGHQKLDESGQQREIYHNADFEQLPVTRVMDREQQPLEIAAPMALGELRLAVWQAQVGSIPLLLLDSDIPANPGHLRGVTDQLYTPEPHRRLAQEIALGIGGLRAVRALGHSDTVLHMNEGHGFLIAAERIRELHQQGFNLESARQQASSELIFTTHTPVAAGSDYFAPLLVENVLGPYLREVGFSTEEFCDLGRHHPRNQQEYLCTTYISLRTAGCSVGVSQLHGEVSKRIWQAAWPELPEAEVPIGSVTNGVHLPTWVAPELQALLVKYVDPRWWELDPAAPEWAGVLDIPNAELWSCHQTLRSRLIEFANSKGESRRPLNPEALTIGFGRRFTPYKRAGLILQDRERINRLLENPERPLQLIFAGKAHPADEAGKAILQQVVQTAWGQPGIVFLPDYDLEIAGLLVQGADVWLNNPIRFLEASGTSGMRQ
ncbi:MAG: alpha-glucan family phosphorylase, partial [Candidatus Dormibacteraceae bacterium]